jgi:hypothetical protein
MTCDSTCELTCDSVPASSCQHKGMPCHDDAGTESQVELQVITQVDPALAVVKVLKVFAAKCVLSLPFLQSCSLDKEGFTI